MSCFNCTELEEQEYKYIILCLELHSSVHMAVAGKDELTRRKPPGNTRVMVGGKLSKSSQVNCHLLLAEAAFSWSTWFIFGDALEFFCSFKFSQWKQNLLSSVGLKTPKGKWKKMWVCEIIIRAQLENSSVDYECKQHPNQRKAWEQNAVLVQTDTVYFLRAENGRTLESLCRFMSGFSKQSRFGLLLLRVIKIKA